MIKNLYCLRDVKSFWLDPFLDVNDESAIRGVSMAVNNADKATIFGFMPKDFDLYCLGSFDTSTGFIKLEENGIPRFVVNAGMIGDGNNAD